MLFLSDFKITSDRSQQTAAELQNIKFYEDSLRCFLYFSLRTDRQDKRRLTDTFP
jgi:hypothetical protein